MLSIVLDWDDTVTKSIWPKPNTEFMPGAVEAIKELAKVYKVIIFTARLSEYEPDGYTLKTRDWLFAERQAMLDLLEEAGIEQLVTIWDKNGKPPGIAFVDDRAICYHGRKDEWKYLVPKLLARGKNREAFREYADKIYEG